MAKVQKPPLVEIEWIDARDQNESFKLVDVAANVRLVHRTTSGYLVLEEAAEIGPLARTILAHDWDAPDEVGNFTVIPSGWVKKVRRIRGTRASAVYTIADKSATVKES